MNYPQPASKWSLEKKVYQTVNFSSEPVAGYIPQGGGGGAFRWKISTGFEMEVGGGSGLLDSYI